MVPVRVLPTDLYQFLLKSVSRPPVSPNEIGCSLRLALTSISRKPVLKNCTAKQTFVVDRISSVLVL